jgi:glutathione S-transferase
MASLKLISHDLCPYAQRAAIVLHEKDAHFERIYIDLRNKPLWFLRLSPLGKVPLLVIKQQDQEAALFESSAIIEYLDETVGPALHPQDPLARAKHRAWIEFASVMLADIAGYYSAPDADRFAEKSEMLRTRFERVEDVLGGPFFGQDKFSLVDAAFAPVFRYFELFDAITGTSLFSDLPNVETWRRSLADRPSVKAAVAADYLERLLAFVRAKGSYLAVLAEEARATLSPCGKVDIPG